MKKSEAQLYLENNPQAKEVLTKRNLTSKHFDNGNGAFTMHAHLGHIHYKDKNDKQFKDVDTTLIPTVNGWEMRKASYEVEIPKYADGWFKFINSFILDPRILEEHNLPEETISIRPVGASHIEGQLITDESDDWQNKKVVYPNAFGPDIDLVIQARNIGFDKLVVINKKPTDLTKDLEFEFEIDVSNDFIFKPIRKVFSPELNDEISLKTSEIKTCEEENKLREKEGKFVEARNAIKLYHQKLGEWEDELVREIWNKETILETSESIIFGKIKKTWFGNFRVWDDEGNQGVCKVRLEEKEGKLFLTKILAKNFLENAIYPVFTDTTTNYFAGNGDGIVYTTMSSWDAAHDDPTGSASYGITAGDSIRSRYYAGPNYQLYRAFFPVDTSGLPDGASISAAVFHLYCYSKINDLNDGDDFARLVQTTSFSTTILVSGDFDACGLVDNPIAGANDLDFGSITNNQYNQWTLNATGRGWISDTGWTKLGMREGHDAKDATVGTSNGNRFSVRWANYADTTSDPYLAVTYTAAAGPADLKSVNTVATADIKSINGVVIASVKSVNTIT